MRIFFKILYAIKIKFLHLQKNKEFMIKNRIANLKNRSSFLFPIEEMSCRYYANRNEVLEFFTPLADIITTKILEAGDCYLQYAEKHTIARRENTFCSSNMHGLIIEHLSQIKDVRIAPISKGNSIIEIGNYKVWVKKLDDNRKPWVNITKSSTKRLYQKAEGEDVMPMLILGYQMDEIERISHIYIIYLEGDQHLWAPIDIGDIAASNQIQLTTNDSNEEPIVTVKPQKQKNKETL